MGCVSMGGNIKTNNMAQTAVDWLIEQIGQFLEINKELGMEIIEQAKAMEKQQIEDAFHAGKINAFLHSEGMSEIKHEALYYNETYGQAD